MSDNIISVSDTDFSENVLQSGTLTLVDFWAEWCAPCRALTPVLSELAESYKGRVQVAKMNIDEHPQTPGQYAVRAIPTLLLFKDGEVVEQTVGLISKDKLDSMLAKHLE